MDKIVRSSLETDKRNNNYKSYHVLKYYRLEHDAFIKGKSTFLTLIRLKKEICFFFLRINAQISYKAEIGNDIRFPHCADGVVISAKAKIYDHQTIYHQVTLGINENLPESEQSIIIHKNCYLSCGCKVISSEIGSNSKIGPNAVVYKNLDNNITYVSTNTIIAK